MKKLLLLLGLVSVLLAEESKLLYVIDGDTVKMQDRVCRLAYIDSPESKRNKKATRDVAKCRNVSLDDIVQGGRLSKRYLKSIMQKGALYQYSVISTDRYGRSVCDFGDINTDLVAMGFAVPFWKYIKNHEVAMRMKSASKKAETEEKGLWRAYPSVVSCMKSSYR